MHMEIKIETLHDMYTNENDVHPHNFIVSINILFKAERWKQHNTIIEIKCVEIHAR